MKKRFFLTFLFVVLFAVEAICILPDEQDPGDGGGGGGGGTTCTWTTEEEMLNTEKLFSVSFCNVNTTEGTVTVKKFTGPSKLIINIRKTIYETYRDHRQKIVSSCPNPNQFRRVQVYQDCIYD